MFKAEALEYVVKTGPFEIITSIRACALVDLRTVVQKTIS
jgi:hypothetical protein